MKKYPEKNTTYFDGEAIPDIEGGLFRPIEEDAATPARTSLASQKWRDECEPIVRRFCREFAPAPEGNVLAGIQVAGGVYGEWHYWGFNGREPDASVPMRDYFRAWLRQKYGDDDALRRAWNDESVTLESAQVPAYDRAQRRARWRFSRRRARKKCDRLWALSARMCR